MSENMAGHSCTWNIMLITGAPPWSLSSETFLFSEGRRGRRVASCANDERAGREGQLRWRESTRNDVDRNDRDGFLVWFYFLRINESWPCSTSLISIIRSLFFFYFASISRNYFFFRSMVEKGDARITPWSSELILGLAAINAVYTSWKLLPCYY
jgi:hypothetical protein